jgi:hypothetical protein
MEPGGFTRRRSFVLSRIWHEGARTTKNIVHRRRQRRGLQFLYGAPLGRTVNFRVGPFVWVLDRIDGPPARQQARGRQFSFVALFNPSNALLLTARSALARSADANYRVGPSNQSGTQTKGPPGS